MEPVGLASSIVAFLEVTKRTTKLIRGIRNAPDELVALSNEAADLELIVTDLEELDRESNLVRTSSETMTMLLIHARVKMNELDGFVRGVLDADASLSAQTFRRRMSWAMGKKKRAQELLAELREVRHNVGAALGLRTA